MNLDFFDEINSEMKAYWLGFLYADGNVFVNDHDNMVTLGLNVKDAHHVKKFADIFGRDSKPRPDGIIRCVICSKYLCAKLIEKGILPNKSGLDITSTFDSVPTQLLHHFIRGIFDGDGSAFVSDNRFRVSFTGNIYTIAKIREMLSELLSISKPKITDHIRSPQTKEVVWAGRRQCFKLASYFYRDATLYLERKFQRFRDRRILS